MGTKALNNRIEKIKLLEQQKADIDKQINDLKKELANELTKAGTDEVDTGLYIVRFKEITSNKFDTKTFKAECSELYSKYLKTSVSKRFSIA